MHLFGERFERRELFLVAELRDELDRQPPPVQVTGEVEQVGLEQRLDAVHGRPGAERGDAVARAAVGAAHLHGEDAAERQARAVQADVGGREAELAAEPRTGDHAPAEHETPAQQPFRRREVAGGQRGTHSGARDARAVDLDGRYGHELEAGGRRRGGERRDAARATAAEAKALADDDVPRAQPIDEHLLDERRRRELPEALVEAHDDQPLDAVAGEREALLGHAHEPRRRAARVEVLARVRVEGQDGRGGAGGLRTGARLAHQRLVPEVHAVEVADGNRRTTGIDETGMEAADELHRDRGRRAGSGDYTARRSFGRTPSHHSTATYTPPPPSTQNASRLTCTHDGAPVHRLKSPDANHRNAAIARLASGSCTRSRRGQWACGTRTPRATSRRCSIQTLT